MKAAELSQMAKDTLARGLGRFQLVVPRSSKGRRRMVVFSKPRLYGEVCSEEDRGTVVFVDALEVIKWLVNSGLGPL